MKFQTTDRRDAGRLQGYLSVYARRKLLEDPNAFCLCALEDGLVVGAAVFEVGKTTYIREINLMEEYCDFAHAGEFLDRLCEISRRCGDGIMFDAHSDDHPYLWEFVLQEEAFQCVNTMEQAEFVLGDALAHPMMSKKGPFKGIFSLAETDSGGAGEGAAEAGEDSRNLFQQGSI
ncbi:MAG: hypothetical protein IJU50_03840 [Lachnospiraceae bacterium]|nr:hypothetical protein [Lachnospiraceae bacterium]